MMTFLRRHTDVSIFAGAILALSLFLGVDVGMTEGLAYGVFATVFSAAFLTMGALLPIMLRPTPYPRSSRD